MWETTEAIKADGGGGLPEVLCIQLDWDSDKKQTSQISCNRTHEEITPSRHVKWLISITNTNKRLRSVLIVLSPHKLNHWHVLELLCGNGTFPAAGQCVEASQWASGRVDEVSNTRRTWNWKNTKISGWRRGAEHVEDEDVNLETRGGCSLEGKILCIDCFSVKWRQSVTWPSSGAVRCCWDVLSTPWTGRVWILNSWILRAAERVEDAAAGEKWGGGGAEIRKISRWVQGLWEWSSFGWGGGGGGELKALTSLLLVFDVHDRKVEQIFSFVV